MSKTILLNQNWIFSKEGHDEPVTLPHTWNAIDGQDGGNDYYRGTCCYTTVLPDIVLPENGRAVLQFDAVAMTAEVYLNEQKLAEHKGGYSAFCVDITDALRNGSNLLRVNVDNSDNDTVYPQKADFTFYGGIYRDVTLHVVPAAHFALAENGAVPVRVTPIVTDLNARRCEVTVEAAVVGAESVTFTLDGQQTSVAVKDVHGDQLSVPALRLFGMIKRTVFLRCLLFLRFCVFFCLWVLGQIQLSGKLRDIFRCRTAAAACHIHSKGSHLLHSVHKIVFVIPGEEHTAGDHLRIPRIGKGCEKFSFRFFQYLQDPVHMGRTHTAVKAHGIDLLCFTRSL